jgi:uncharacterized protein
MPFSTYCIPIDNPDSPDQVILFSTRTAAAVTLHRDVIKDIEAGRLSSDERETLSELGFIVQDLKDEREEMRSYIDDLNKVSKTLTVTLVMNLDCNLACPYCFEGTRKGKHYLSEETADDFFRFIGNRLPELEELNIRFYGGEPLLSFDMIYRIARELARAATEARVKFSFGFVTNGTLLTRRVVEKLRPLGLKSAYVTLDGPAEMHDTSRPFRNGSGSFNTIIGNLRSVSDLIELHLGGNYLQTNYREFPRLLDFLIAHGLGPDVVSLMSFSPIMNEDAKFCPDYHDGCSNDNEPWVAEAGLELRREIGMRGYRTDEVLPAVCMLERHDHLVINWDGVLYKCPGLIGRKEYGVGTLKSGMLDYTATHNLGNWNNEQCLACKYLPLCFGGCRHTKLICEGTMKGIECKKEFFGKALEALVLQDIEYNKAPES